MKKFLVITLVFVIIVACTGNGDYKYANAACARIPNTPIDAKLVITSMVNGIMRDHAETVEIDLRQYKETIEACLGGYSNLDWPQFHGIEDVSRLGMGAIFDTLSDSAVAGVVMFKVSQEAAAMNVGDAIILLPSYECYDEDEQFFVMVHELIHSLVPDEAKVPLEEGLDDYLTRKVAKSLGRHYIPHYRVGYLAMIWLVTIFGEEDAVAMVSDGRLCEAVDAATKDGMGECLAWVVSNLDCPDRNGGMASAMLDILVHLAKNAGKEVEALALLKKSDELFSSLGLEVDYSYFENILVEPSTAKPAGGVVKPRLFHARNYRTQISEICYNSIVTL